MWRLTHNNCANGKNHNQDGVLTSGVPRTSDVVNSYFALNNADKKNASIKKLKISGLTSVREININIERTKETIIGQKPTLTPVDNRLRKSIIHRGLMVKSKSINVTRTTKILSKIRPVNPPKL